MFAMSRFDPSVEDQKAHNKKKSEMIGSSIETKLAKRKKRNENVVEEKFEQENDVSNSSSIYSFSDDSSSGESEDKLLINESTQEQSTLKVIAPEQNYENEWKTQRRNTTTEGMDDFDDDTQLYSLQNAHIQNAMDMTKVPIRKVAELWNLQPFLIRNLERDGHKYFFPIQALVIPDVIASERHAHVRNRDICVSAPTGSGKTLSFVLPVLNSLASCSSARIRRLRALVVLPSRDLASQVFQVFQRYSEGSHLKIGLAIGQGDFKAEQTALTIGNDDTKYSKEARRFQYVLNPLDIGKALDAFRTFDYSFDEYSLGGCWATGNIKDHSMGICEFPNGGISNIDVLICTPGRLVAHLESTPGFTLQHLRFLIIDEADRLLTQSYHNWIDGVMKAANSGYETLQRNGSHGLNTNNQFDPITWRKDQGMICRPVQLRKLLFSATLTKDPRKLSSIGLINPKHYDALHLKSQSQKTKDQSDTTTNTDQEQHTYYALPEALTENTLVCNAEQKPLVLLALLLDQAEMNKKASINDGNSLVVVFTSSLDSTHRLARLLQILWVTAGYGPVTAVAEFSSALTQQQRTSLINQCNNPGENASKVEIIVCSDGMSRGMDISSVTAVINYDVPSFAKTYIHRCGRTARANRSGKAITILKRGQIGSFMKMRKLIEFPENVKESKVRKDLVQSALPLYKSCLRKLKEVMKAEAKEEISPVSTLGPQWIPKSE
jgi:ATP-dependent RNA helicase DDX51/DBP6